MRIAQRLEQHEPGAALRDQGFDRRQRANAIVLERLGVAFVVDVELRQLVQAVRQQVGAGPLDSHQEQGRGRRLLVALRQAPPGLPDRAPAAHQRIEVVLLDEMGPAVRLAPAPVLPDPVNDDACRVSRTVVRHGWPAPRRHQRDERSAPQRSARDRLGLSEPATPISARRRLDRSQPARPHAASGRTRHRHQPPAHPRTLAGRS